MGYSHYWRVTEELSREKFIEFAEGVKQLVATAQEAGVAIGDEEYSDSVIVFNGVAGDAHESFFFTIKGDEFNFCKTAEKPYDIAVTASLILAKKIFGDAITVTSDGSWNNWQSGQLLYESVFNTVPESVFA